MRDYFQLRTRLGNASGFSDGAMANSLSPGISVGFSTAFLARHFPCAPTVRPSLSFNRATEPPDTP